MTCQATAAMFAAARYAAVSLALLTVLLNILFLGTALYIHRTPIARPHIDRVSFRLLVWIMAAEMVYSMAYVTIYADDSMTDKLGRVPAACSTAMTVLLGSRNTVNWLFSCIAINLMIRICFLYNPIERRLEKIYVVGSFVLGFGIAIIGAGIGMYGIFYNSACFFAGDTRQEAIISMMVTSWLWQAISTGASIIAIAAVFMTLVRRYRVFTSGILGRSLALANPSEEPKCSTRRTSWCPKLPRFKQNDMTVKPEQEFITLAAKISVYPLTLIITNGITIWGDMFFFAKAPTGQGEYFGMVLYYLMYGGRGVLLAMVALFVDPSLRTGWKAARKSRQVALARGGLLGAPGPREKIEPNRAWFARREHQHPAPEISHLHPETHFPPTQTSPRPLLGGFVSSPLQVVLAPISNQNDMGDIEVTPCGGRDRQDEGVQMTIQEMLSVWDSQSIPTVTNDALYRLPTQL